jgi:hypothetical protein
MTTVAEKENIKGVKKGSMQQIDLWEERKLPGKWTFYEEADKLAFEMINRAKQALSWRLLSSEMLHHVAW